MKSPRKRVDAKRVEAPEKQAQPRLGSALVVLWFAILFSLVSINSLLENSPTVDEPVHLLAGYSYLRWGDFRVNPEHPPLAKLWAAVPLLGADIRDPRPQRPQWDLITRTSDHQFANHLAQDMIFLDNDAETLFFLAKSQMVLLGIVLGFFVFQWSHKLFGFSSAIVALFLYGLDPNIIAHSQIVHSDMPFAAFYFISTYYFWRSMREVSYHNLILTSVFFGLAAITKYSFIAILPSWLAIAAIMIFRPEPLQCNIGLPRQVFRNRQKTSLCLVILACCALTAYFAIWTAYGFRFAATPDGRVLPLADISLESAWLKSLLSTVAEYRLFPEAWIYGQAYVVRDLARRTYLLGELLDQGSWGYFPIAFFVKTPLPTILALVLALVAWLRAPERRSAGFLLVIPAVIYFSIAVASKLNIGLRHILPVYPFLFVALSGFIVRSWKDSSTVKKSGWVLLAAWYLWSCAGIYPHYLAYFNELAGGPANGYKVLVDSNLDWGQGTKALKKWLDGRGIEEVQLVSFGYAEAEYYGIDAVGLPGRSLGYVPPPKNSSGRPQYLAVNLTVLGLYQDQPLVKFLKDKIPVATVGYSINVYKLD